MILPFTIVQPLDSGGFGDLWLARWLATGESVVVKYLRDAHIPDVMRAFAREVRILQRGHAGIVRLIHADLSGPRPYYVMPYLRGGSLTRHAGSLGHAQLVAVATEVATALSGLHGTGTIHGDVKPDNALVTDDGHLQVADPLGHGWGCTVMFGVNRGGTPGYWAPEIAAGGSMSKAGDVYSYGATLFHLATGVVPKDGLVLRLELRPGIPRRLVKVVEACCQGDPARRPTMADVIIMLQGEELEAIRKRKRGAWVAGGLAVGLVALILAGGGQ